MCIMCYMKRNGCFFIPHLGGFSLSWMWYRHGRCSQCVKMLHPSWVTWWRWIAFFSLLIALHLFFKKTTLSCQEVDYSIFHTAGCCFELSWRSFLCGHLELQYELSLVGSVFYSPLAYFLLIPLWFWNSPCPNGPCFIVLQQIWTIPFLTYKTLT